MGKPDHSPSFNADVESDRSNTSGVVQLYLQAPGTSSGRLLRPGGGPALSPGNGYKFWSPLTTWGWSSYSPRHRIQVLVAFLRPAWAAVGLIFPGHHMGKADHSPPSNSDVKSERRNTSSRLYTLDDVYRTTLPS